MIVVYISYGRPEHCQEGGGYGRNESLSCSITAQRRCNKRASKCGMKTVSYKRLKHK